MPEFSIQDIKKDQVNAAKLCSLIAIVFLPLSSVLDYYIYPQCFFQFFGIRMILVFGCFFIFFLTSIKIKHSPNFYMLFMAGSITFGFSLMGNLAGEGYASDYYIGIIEVMFTVVMMPFSTRLFVFLLIFIYLIYLFTMHFIHPVPYLQRYFVENNVFLIESIIMLSCSHYYISSLRKKLQNANQHIKFMTSVFVHDIKNIIVTPVNMLKHEKVLLKENPEIINPIRNQLENALLYLGNLLNLSIHEEHGIKVLKQKVPSSLIQEHLEKNYSEICSLDGIDLKISLEDLNLNIDKKYFLPVINNLMANAMQNIEQANKKIEISCRQNSALQVSELILANTGAFIPQESRPCLFQHSQDKNKYTPYSKGLGLRFCYLIVSLHGGKITYHANPHTRMNEFLITIPN